MGFPSSIPESTCGETSRWCSPLSLSPLIYRPSADRDHVRSQQLMQLCRTQMTAPISPSREMGGWSVGPPVGSRLEMLKNGVRPARPHCALHCTAVLSYSKLRLVWHEELRIFSCQFHCVFALRTAFTLFYMSPSISHALGAGPPKASTGSAWTQATSAARSA
jgi:hypothetical protein